MILSNGRRQRVSHELQFWSNTIIKDVHNAFATRDVQCDDDSRMELEVRLKLMVSEVVSRRLFIQPDIREEMNRRESISPRRRTTGSGIYGFGILDFTAEQTCFPFLTTSFVCRRTESSSFCRNLKETGCATFYSIQEKDGDALYVSGSKVLFHFHESRSLTLLCIKQVYIKKKLMVWSMLSSYCGKKNCPENIVIFLHIIL